MKIQLLTQDKKVLYELDQSELFPDYRSVLHEAITLQIDLSGLVVDSQQLDEMTWWGAKIKSVLFRNCSLKKNKFVNCNIDEFYVGGCDFTASKFKKSKLKDFHILNSDCSKVSFRDCSLSNHFFLDCNFIKTEFYNCRMDDISFNSTNLAGTFFNNCEINKGNFVHSEENTDWLSETGFVGCRLSGCEFQSPINISTMYFLETNAYDLSLIEDEKFTEIYNKYSNVLYAIDSDVVWWKPNSYNKKVGIFRGSLKEFSDEVRNGFPTTDIWPDVEVLIGSELEHVIKYLESWKKRFE